MTKPKYMSGVDTIANSRDKNAIISYADGTNVYNAEYCTGSTFQGRTRAHSRMNFDPRNVGGDGISGRYDFTTSDYEAWRPGETSVFHNDKARILHANRCYKNHGLIRNVVDLMGDFGSQGIRLVHPNKRIQRFYVNWFDKVNGPEVSDKILNILYRLANCPIRIQTAKINTKERDRLFRANAKPDMKVENPAVNKNEIPWKYTLLHPATIITVGGALSSFSGKPQYAIQLPRHINNKFSNIKDGSVEQEVLNSLPDDIRAAIEKNKPILLPQDKFKILFYKKDDWEEFAHPIVSSIAVDISLYEKMKLADRSALDGAISNIRIFKLGSLEHKLAPQEGAFELLSSILESNTEGGTLDLVWGPDIELIESKTDVHKFLGEEKYKPTLMAIYAGLGIPPTLTGTFGGTGTTNNFISLKTLTQRLEYGRELLTQFWNEQIKMVQEAMGFRFPARVEFDMMNLGDEAAEKALLIQLSDRNLISDELLQRYWGSDPEMENIRMKNENKERKGGQRTEKAGPYYSPQIEDALKKIALQSGVATPSEVGLELGEKQKGQEPALVMRQPKESTNNKPTGVSGQGRPKNSKDSEKRKEKDFKPKTRAVWASKALDDISKAVNPFILGKFGKKDMRSLSSEEFKQSELIKFGVLCNIQPYSKINNEIISEALNTDSSGSVKAYESWESAVSKELDRKLTVNEQRMIQCEMYNQMYGETQ